MSRQSVRVDWFSGAGAQLEVFGREEGEGAEAANYRLRYVPPFRATIRPPLLNMKLGSGELRTLLEELDRLAQHVEGASTRGNDDPQKRQLLDGRDSQAQATGHMLFDIVVPKFVEADLRTSGLFVELGVDEELVQYPWELMHDGDDFLCLKHYVGRFVNSRSTNPGYQSQQPVLLVGKNVDKLSILLVSVPKPDVRDGANSQLPPLPGAERETEAILETLAGLESVQVSTLTGPHATYGNLFQALKSTSYHVIHFVGHAVFNDNRPNESALVLKDRDMTTGALSSYIGRTPPVLCFVNGCQSGKSAAWVDNYNMYGLAQAFLDTGSYLIGSRWNLEDDPAVTFAAEFYSKLAKEQQPIGMALAAARRKTRNDWAQSFAWASYVFYGDPRVFFHRTEQPLEGQTGG